MVSMQKFIKQGLRIYYSDVKDLFLNIFYCLVQDWRKLNLGGGGGGMRCEK